jgi:hypothetical protein
LILEFDLYLLDVSYQEGPREDAAARRSADRFLQRVQPVEPSFQDRELMKICCSRMDAAAPLNVLLAPFYNDIKSLT